MITGAVTIGGDRDVRGSRALLRGRTEVRPRPRPLVDAEHGAARERRHWTLSRS
jgi:hypothetical protein